eukprot:2960767-Lingulodinium_polyedra.AAC.1
MSAGRGRRRTGGRGRPAGWPPKRSARRSSPANRRTRASCRTASCTTPPSARRGSAANRRAQ